MDEVKMGFEAEKLVSKLKHYLITTMGVTADEATDEEFYRAFSLAIREEIMINWTATSQTIKNAKARTIYYLCMEYMPGKMLKNNIENLQIQGLIGLVLKKMNRDLQKIYAMEPDPGLGNGGLGRLASCLLDSLATQQYPALAYGLRYQYGIFEQQIWNGVQMETPDLWLRHENPWEFRRDGHATAVAFSGKPVRRENKKGVEVFDVTEYEEVRAIAYDMPIVGYKKDKNFSVLTLRLWTTKESPRNFELQRFNAGMLDQAAENLSLTDVLYPNDNNEVGKRIRLKQEFLLASASIQDIIKTHLKNFPDMQSFADKVRIQINDTHPSIVIVELCRLLVREHDFGWQEAWEVVQTCCSYANHTVLKESLEEWNQNRIRYLLPRQYRIIEKMNLEMCNEVRKKFPDDEERVRRMSILEAGQVRMAHLAIFASHKVNGVSALHTDILKMSIFKDFQEMYPDRFVNITNGVTQRRFILLSNLPLALFISERIGREWITDFKQIQKMGAYADDLKSQQQFLQIKKEAKQKLIAYLKEYNPIRDGEGEVVGYPVLLGDDALFDMQIKRIHEYKRQLMNALHLIILYQELKADPTAHKIKRMVLFAGKAAPGYEMAKNVIRLIVAISRKINSDSTVNEKLRVLFVENYNVTHAEKMIPAADISEQISTAGTEASGTGNMKLTMNGAMTVATEDGANIEMRQAVGDTYWPFIFGNTAVQNEALRPQYNPWDIYMHRLPIRQAVDALRDQTFAETEQEHKVFCTLYQSLLEPHNTDTLDLYFVLSDLQSYCDIQAKVEELFLQPYKWAQMAIRNIAGMGSFSSDVAVSNYAKFIWDLKPCPVGAKELEKIQSEYSEHDKCRIFAGG